MESRQSIVLCIIYALFLILGAVMFMFLEYEETETKVITEPPEWSNLKGELHEWHRLKSL